MFGFPNIGTAHVRILERQSVSLAKSFNDLA